MLKDCSEKKLLIIGANSFFIDVIEICKKYHITSIILDDNPKAVSKPLADISLNVDTYDKQAVLDVAKKYHVDGIFVGWSDNNLYTAEYVATQLELPFYATKEQLDITTDKQRFKEECVKYNIPVFKELTYEELINSDDKHFTPVIVKPIDSAGSKGITACYKKADLESAYEKALAFSPSKHVIIEELGTYQHINIYYTLADGEIFLSAICDRNVYYLDRKNPPLPSHLKHPSNCIDSFVKKENIKIIKMFKGLNMRDGMAFVQGFYDKLTDNFYFYEMGYRLNGGSTYFLMDRIWGYNILEMMINHALTGSMGDITSLKKASPYFPLDAYIIVLPVLHGVITKIEGLDTLANESDIFHILPMYQEGDIIKNTGNVSHTMIFGYLYAIPKSISIDSLLTKIYETVKVYDDNKNNLLIRPTILNKMN